MSQDWSSILKQDLQKLSEGLCIQPAKTEQLIPGERREIARLFIGLKGFTTISETKDNETIHNKYFESQ